MTRPQGTVSAHVVFIRPSGSAEHWARTDLWTAAEGIPGVQVHRDDSGALSRLFGARTSGQMLLYDTAGRLRFSGGITAARGHAGDNVGSHRVRQLIADAGQPSAQASVFGCPLLDEGDREECDDGGCPK